jgi:hypothetical protein
MPHSSPLPTATQVETTARVTREGRFREESLRANSAKASTSRPKNSAFDRRHAPIPVHSGVRLRALRRARPSQLPRSSGAPGNRIPQCASSAMANASAFRQAEAAAQLPQSRSLRLSSPTSPPTASPRWASAKVEDVELLSRLRRQPSRTLAHPHSLQHRRQNPRALAPASSRTH